jgi:hypothetical protein
MASPVSAQQETHDSWLDRDGRGIQCDHKSVVCVKRRQDLEKAYTLALFSPISEMGLIRDPLEKPKKALTGCLALEKNKLCGRKGACSPFPKAGF